MLTGLSFFKRGWILKELVSHNVFSQVSPAGSIPSGIPSLAGIAPTGPQWVQLKTYHPGRQPGPPYRGTRFDRTTVEFIRSAHPTCTVNLRGFYLHRGMTRLV